MGLPTKTEQGNVSGRLGRNGAAVPPRRRPGLDRPATDVNGDPVVTYRYGRYGGWGSGDSRTFYTGRQRKIFPPFFYFNVHMDQSVAV